MKTFLPWRKEKCDYVHSYHTSSKEIERQLTPEFFDKHPAQWRKKRQIALDSK